MRPFKSRLFQAGLAVFLASLVAITGIWSSIRLTVTSNSQLISINVALAQGPPYPIGEGTYAVLEPSGCSVEKNQVRLRIDMYLGPKDPYYNLHYLYLVDEASPEFIAGYKGKMDSKGKPVDPADYDKWWAGLPRIWKNTPFHSHFLYVNPTSTDAQIKIQMQDVLGYFYSFHEACWETGKDFLSEWKRVPPTGIRAVPTDGNPQDTLLANAKVQEIKNRIADFGLQAIAVEGTFTLPTGEQTIDIGPGAIDRASQEDPLYTYIIKTNPANASGVTDTFEIWANTNMTLCECATFFVVSGDNLSTRDTEAIGSVTAGSKQTFTGLTMDTVINDYLGVYFATGKLDMATTGGGGIWYEGADRIPCTTNAFGVVANWEMSIYATGVSGSFPVVESSAVTSDTATATTTAVNYPATVSAGALLICIARATVAGAIGWPTGWNELVEDNSDASDDVTAIAWRAAVGDEDGTTFNVTHGNGKMAAIVYSITGAAGSTVQPPELSTVAVATGTTPNPTTCTPTGGAKDYLWLWLGGWEGEQTSPPANNPTSYAGQLGANTATSGAVTTNCRVASSQRIRNAASEDPGSWTISASDDWSAWCMAVHPPPPSIELDIISYNFGVVVASSTPYSATNYFTIDNTSTIQTDQTIGVTTTTWGGTTTWAHSETAEAAAGTAGLLANRGGSWGTGDIIIRNASPLYIYENCPITTDYSFGLKLIAPSSFAAGDSSQKTIVVRITAAAG